RGEKTFGGLRHAALPEDRRRSVQAEILPWLRGRLSAEKRVVATVQDDEKMLRFLGSHDGPRPAALGTSCPDHFLRTKLRPLLAGRDPARGDLDALKAELEAGLERYRRDYARPTSGAGGPTPPPCATRARRSFSSPAWACSPSARPRA